MSGGELVTLIFTSGAVGAVLKFGGDAIKTFTKRGEKKEEQPSKDMLAIAAGSVQAVESMGKTIAALQRRAEEAERKLAEVTATATAWLVRAQQAEDLLHHHGIQIPQPDDGGN